VLANKGPVVLAFRELHATAGRTGAGLKYSATVCGGLPVLNIGRRDMIAGEILRLRGVFNATTNFILDEMAAGVAYGDALAEAQRRGIAEADPSLDVDGWDTANKLLIIANSLLGADISLEDIEVTGIAGVTTQMIAAEAALGNVIRLVASAEAGRYSVAPLALPGADFLAQCKGWEMAVEMLTDIYGINYHKLWEREPTPTAASMLRDAVHIFAPPAKF
jgi:homoserine dehydrogenase